MNESTVDLSKPVMWTAHGNLNEDQLEKFCDFEMDPYGWVCRDQFTRDAEIAAAWTQRGEFVVPLFSTIVCVVGAKLKATGEIVKRGVYVQPMPQQVNGVAAPFN